MKVAVSAMGPTLEAELDPRFGRCAYFVIVDPEDKSFEAVANSAGGLGGGAGIQAARLVAERGVALVLTGRLGPNAQQTLDAAGVEVVVGCCGKVAEAVDRYRSGPPGAR